MFSRSDLQRIAKNDLTTFIEGSFYTLNPQSAFVHSPHLEVIASKLEACRAGACRRLIINLPPRSLKSHSVTVAFVAYLLGHNPAEQIICVSYGQDLSEKHARDCRTLMNSPFYRCLFPNTLLSAERQAVNDFMTTAQGFRMATSVGGVVTGRGSNFIILDDPIKPEDAMSETKRNGANEWCYFVEGVTFRGRTKIGLPPRTLALSGWRFPVELLFRTLIVTRIPPQF